MRGFQSFRPAVVRKVLDLLSLSIEECAAGGIACEVTAFAVDHDAVILASELAHPVRALGDPHVADLTNERGGLVVQQCDVRIGCLAAVVEGKPSPNAQGARRRRILAQSPSAKVNDMNSIVAHRSEEHTSELQSRVDI